MRHYHVEGKLSHPDNRTIYYHDHPASFIWEDGKGIVHDHHMEMAHYPQEEDNDR